MKQLFFFLCVLAIAYCAPERCCLPKQFLADHSVFQEVGNDRGTAFLEYTVDSIANNLRIDLYANWSGVIYYFTIWDLYSSVHIFYSFQLTLSHNDAFLILSINFVFATVLNPLSLLYVFLTILHFKKISTLVLNCVLLGT